MSRIVVATIGTLGDLHPFLAIGRALADRGHDVVMATSSHTRARVRRERLQWRRLRPDLPFTLSAEQGRRLIDRRFGLDRTLDELVMPALTDTTSDLRAAADGADLILGSSLVLPASAVAAAAAVPFVAAILQPMMFYSAHDPWVPPSLPWLRGLHAAGPVIGWPMRALLRHSLRRFERPLRAAGAEKGLPAGTPPPPRCTLGLFSPLFGAPQRDWPRPSMVTGFPFHDGENTTYPNNPDLDAFCADEAPIVFTLGSSAVHAPGDFYVHAEQAAAALGRRAVLLTGLAPMQRPCPPGVMRVSYAPFGRVFPHACAVVHQGGVGTTAQAMRAGVPMVIVPFAFDQEDNAARAVRLNVARRVSRERCGAASLTQALRTVLNDQAIAARCADLRVRIGAEDGLGAACAAIEAVLA